MILTFTSDLASFVSRRNFLLWRICARAFYTLSDDHFLCCPAQHHTIACLLCFLVVATMSSFSRRGSLMPKPPPTQLIRNEDPEKTKERMLRGPTAGAWKKIGVGKHFGMCVPLFGLKTKESCGIGEYLDLIPMGMITSTSSLLPNTVLCLSSPCTHFFC